MYRLALLLIAVLARDALACEPGQLRAIDLVQPALLSGPWHRVEPCVDIDGHLARFSLVTPWGPLVADGTTMLEIRVAEMPAVAALMAVDDAELASDEAIDRARRRGGQFARLAREPVETAKAAPRGLWRYFRARVDRYAKRAAKYGRVVADAATDRDEAYDDPPSLRPGVVPESSPLRSWWSRRGRDVGKLTLDELGYRRARRELGRTLLIDPYTSNPLIAERLDRLAWTALLTDRTLDALLALGGAPLVSAFGYAQALEDHVWSAEPEDLEARDRERLERAGCATRGEIARFLRNRRITPTQQLALVDALLSLDASQGCADLLELAAALRSEPEVHYLIVTLREIAQARADTGATVVLDLAGTLPFATLRLVDGKERVFLPLPLDRLQWTPETRAALDHPRLRASDRWIITSGQMSPRAQRALTARGWTLVQRGAAPVD